MSIDISLKKLSAATLSLSLPVVRLILHLGNGKMGKGREGGRQTPSLPPSLSPSTRQNRTDIWTTALSLARRTNATQR